MRSWAVRCLSLVVLLLSVRAGAFQIVIGRGGNKEDPDKAVPLPDGALACSGRLPEVAPVETIGGGGSSAYRVALSPDGRRAAIAWDDGKVRIWDTANAKLLATIAAHQGDCHAVCFAPDGFTVFSCSNDQTVRQWDVATGNKVGEFDGHEGSAKSIACSPDGQHLASADSKGIRIYDLRTRKLLRTLTGHKVPILPGPAERTIPLTIDALAFSPDGRTLVSEANDETARIWDALTGQELRMLPYHDGAAAAVALSPDGTLGVSVRGNMTYESSPRLRIWEVATGRVLRSLMNGNADVTCDAFAPDGRYILSGSSGIDDQTLRQWEVDTGTEIRCWQLSSPPMSVAYGPDGKFAVTLSAAEGVVIWDLTAAPRMFGPKVAIGSLDEAWRKLASPEHQERAAAFNYYCKQVAPDEAAAELRRRLQEVTVDEAARAAQRRLIARLDDPEYTVRFWAFDELAEMGARARGELAAAAEHPSPEVRSRVGELLQAIGGPADFSSVLALEVLAVLKTPAAKAELERVAASSLPCAIHAKALLARFAK